MCRGSGVRTRSLVFSRSSLRAEGRVLGDLRDLDGLPPNRVDRSWFRVWVRPPVAATFQAARPLLAEAVSKDAHRRT